MSVVLTRQRVPDRPPDRRGAQVNVDTKDSFFAAALLRDNISEVTGTFQSLRYELAINRPSVEYKFLSRYGDAFYRSIRLHNSSYHEGCAPESFLRRADLAVPIPRYPARVGLDGSLPAMRCSMVTRFLMASRIAPQYRSGAS
jgi:hypothetical protein